MARFRVVTKHQVSGWRFLFRRIEHALVRRDPSMIDDPQRGRSTALTVGVAIVCIVIAGAAVMAFLKPAKKAGDSKILADKETGALYVRIGPRLHPALNLTSARLIIGSPDKPAQVTRDELAKFPRGGWVGIPGAPGAIVDTAEQDSSWTVCDAASGGAAAPVDPRTGLPTVALSAVRTTVIGGALTIDGADIRRQAEGEARLMRDDRTTWLVYTDGDRGAVRAEIDLSDTAVVLSLGIDSAAPVLAVSRGLINALPEAPPLRAPAIPGAGEIVTLSSGLTTKVGAVVATSVPGQEIAQFIVTRSGLIRASTVVASMVRNAEQDGAATTATVSPAVVATNLRPGSLPGTDSFPSRPVHIAEPGPAEVTCMHWSRSSGDPRAATELLTGTRLPLTVQERQRTVDLVTSGASEGTTATAAYLPRDTGRFVQVTGVDQDSPLRTSLFWISDSGVRYGVVAELGRSSPDPTLTALALREPVLAPWNVISLFAVGPSLSQDDAKIAHDGIPADKAGVGFGGGQP
ncbi:ESX-3 secretion system ATPase EccB3 [Nocardia neocaledoniensis NBRC 108232]|uniref:Type VII secretion protein EccB n=1 Tax=Nocardia neocaledoniensis TaxID=236511 RepID=A0A317N200_9NOCA|nr:type VII secretion protein EccB [Nocardia neocaledoniensis]PWV66956.1 type VII secretion protein EccB [Nocardia neocaledoniensis]GEM31307.1 ESX-3 secretion system ATPase EccB3 [Nocardia neocaledoniensis NBRC 108232]